MNSTAKYYSKWLAIFTAWLCVCVFLGVLYVRADNAAWSLYYGLLSGYMLGVIRACWRDYKNDERLEALRADIDASIAEFEARAKQGMPVSRVTFQRGNTIIDITPEVDDDDPASPKPKNESES